MWLPLWYDAAMNTHVVETFLVSELSADDCAALDALGLAVYPPGSFDGFRVPVSAPAPEIDWPAERARRVFFVRHDDGLGRRQIVATSQFLPRRIRTSQGPLDALALAGVKTHPDFRHLGLGSAVVRAAFEHVDRGVFPVSFFQTGVPAFYELLTCRRVHNPCINHLAANPAERPWWEQHTMIYPATYPWPEGPIDLCGPGW